MVVFAMDAEGVDRRFEPLLEVVGAAYGAPSEHFRSGLQHSMHLPGFRLVAAEDGARLVGLAYGHDLNPDQRLYPWLAQFLDGPARAHWLGDAYQVVELVVEPGHQLQGLGVRLLNCLLEGVAKRTSVLPVRQESVAQILCERHGWLHVLDELHVAPDGPIYAVMGRVNNACEDDLWAD